MRYFPRHGNGIAIDWRHRKFCLKLDSGLQVYSCAAVIQAEVRTRVELHVERMPSTFVPQLPAAAGTIYLNIAIKDGAEITTAGIWFLETSSALPPEDYQVALRNALLAQALICGPLGHQGDVLEVQLAEHMGDLVDRVHGEMDYYQYLNFIAANPQLNDQPAGRPSGNCRQELLREVAIRVGEIERLASRPKDSEALAELENILVDPRERWFVKNAAAAALHTIGTVGAMKPVEDYRNAFISQVPQLRCTKCNGTHFWFRRGFGWQCSDCKPADRDVLEVDVTAIC